MIVGVSARKDLLGKTRVETLMLRVARLGETLIGKIRVGKALIEARFGKACVARARFGETCICKALIPVGLAVEALGTVIARSRIGLRPGMLGPGEARRVGLLIGLAPKFCRLVTRRGVVTGRRVLRILVARRGAGLRTLIARCRLGKRACIVQGRRRVRARIAQPRSGLLAGLRRKRLSRPLLSGRVRRVGRRFGDLLAQIGAAGDGRIRRHLRKNGAPPAKHRALSGCRSVRSSRSLSH